MGCPDKPGNDGRMGVCTRCRPVLPFRWLRNGRSVMAESKSHAERHASAAETFTKFAPDVEPERIADSFARRQGALGSMAFDVVGAMWSRPQLVRRDRSLLVISVLAAQARGEELESHTR